MRYTLSERSNAVKTILIQFNLKKTDGREVSKKITRKPIIIVLAENERNIKIVRRKLKQKTRGMIKDDIINNFSVDISNKDLNNAGLYWCDLEIDDEAERKILEFYRVNRIEEEKEENEDIGNRDGNDDREDKKDDGNEVSLGGVPNVSGCCSCCGKCCTCCKK